MNNDTIAIITRAFNRLEYTIRCVNAVRDHTKYPDYVHYVVSQGSYDGTQLWLDNMIRLESNWYPHLVPIHPGRNLGTTGGTRNALKHAVDLVVILDNDMEVLEDGWLSIMREIFLVQEKEVRRKGGKLAALMAKRAGVARNKSGKEWARQVVGDKRHLIHKVSQPGACFMTRKEIIEQIPRMQKHVEIGTLGTTLKIMDLPVLHMDGQDVCGPGTYRQNEKYKPKGKRA